MVWLDFTPYEDTCGLKTHTITDHGTYEGTVIKGDLPHRHILPKVEDWEIEGKIQRKQQNIVENKDNIIVNVCV